MLLVVAQPVRLMKAFHHLMLCGALAMSFNLTGCVIDDGHPHGRYDEARHDHDDRRDGERAERRDRDDRCAAREPSVECRDR